MKKVRGIYEIVNTENGKRDIGSSLDIDIKLEGEL